MLKLSITYFILQSIPSYANIAYSMLLLWLLGDCFSYSLHRPFIIDINFYSIRSTNFDFPSKTIFT